jgi:hypothetical protein
MQEDEIGRSRARRRNLGIFDGMAFERQDWHGIRRPDAGATDRAAP